MNIVNNSKTNNGGTIMEKKLLILSILAVLGLVGVILFQTSILNNAFLAGFGYILGVLSIIIGVIIALIYK